VGEMIIKKIRKMQKQWMKRYFVEVTVLKPLCFELIFSFIYVD